jgi:ketosteroid isomerase-like protein
MLVPIPANRTGEMHMKGLIGAALLACIWVEPVLAGTSDAPSQGSSVADSIRQEEQAWEDAVQSRDVDTAAKIEADDWRCIGTDGRVWTKQQDLSGLKSGTVKHIPLELGARDVKMLSENIVVIQGIATDRRTMGGDNAGPAVNYAYMDVWVKDADGWRVVRSQTTKVK